MTTEQSIFAVDYIIKMRSYYLELYVMLEAKRTSFSILVLLPPELYYFYLVIESLHILLHFQEEKHNLI